MDKLNHGHHWLLGIALGLCVVIFGTAVVVGLLAYPMFFVVLAAGLAGLAFSSGSPSQGDAVVRLAHTVARRHSAELGGHGEPA